MERPWQATESGGDFDLALRAVDPQDLTVAEPAHDPLLIFFSLFVYLGLLGDRSMGVVVVLSLLMMVSTTSLVLGNNAEIRLDPDEGEITRIVEMLQ